MKTALTHVVDFPPVYKFKWCKIKKSKENKLIVNYGKNLIIFECIMTEKQELEYAH